MKRLILMVVVGVLAFPATALASVSPEKQALMAERGYTVADEWTDAAIPAGMKQCAHGRAKKLGSRIRNAAGGTLIRGSMKLAVCAANGHVYWSNVVPRHASPSVFWKGDGKPNWFIKGCCGGGRWAYYVMSWTDPDYSVDRSWQLTINIRAHVRGDHDIWFSKTRAWR